MASSQSFLWSFEGSVAVGLSFAFLEAFTPQRWECKGSSRLRTEPCAPPGECHTPQLSAQVCQPVYRSWKTRQKQSKRKQKQIPGGSRAVRLQSMAGGCFVWTLVFISLNFFCRAVEGTQLNLQGSHPWCSWGRRILSSAWVLPSKAA